MGSLKLYINTSPIVFGGVQRSFSEAFFVVLGFPFDSTSSYHPGARFGPLAIREASLNIETWSWRAGMDFEDLGCHDLGDLAIVLGDVHETLRRAQEVLEDLYTARKIPIVLGGEHTITLASARTQRNAALICFDAHFDLRNEYLSQRVSHATVMRRVLEVVNPEFIYWIGVRATCREEQELLRSRKLNYMTPWDLRKLGTLEAARRVKEKIKEANKVYISVDVDVLDPAYAPDVGNPEPEGLTPSELLDMLKLLVDARVIGADIVEVVPIGGRGLSAIQAAKIACELCCLIYRAKTSLTTAGRTFMKTR